MGKAHTHNVSINLMQLLPLKRKGKGKEELRERGEEGKTEFPTRGYRLKGAICKYHLFLPILVDANPHILLIIYALKSVYMVNIM